MDRIQLESRSCPNQRLCPTKSQVKRSWSAAAVSTAESWLTLALQSHSGTSVPATFHVTSPFFRSHIYLFDFLKINNIFLVAGKPLLNRGTLIV